MFMLLDGLIQITENGAKKPLFLWFEKYKELVLILKPDLNSLLEKLGEGTEIKTNIKNLVQILDHDHPEELDLARALFYLVDIFNDEAIPSDKQGVVQEYVTFCRKFNDRAQTSDFHRRERELLNTRMSAEEQRAYDLKLYKNEGMVYCMELFLALYKAITSAKTETEKRKYIESMEVNLGSGRVPGLWNDFKQDDMLTRFIYKILDNTTRENLMRVYYDLKNELMNIDLQCDKQGHCSSDYHGATVEAVMVKFKAFLQVVLDVFSHAGLSHMTSYMLAPYGKQPKISEIKL